MGGNALKEHETVRLNRSDFQKLEKKCVDVLRKLYPNSKINSLKYYRNKPDFGDLDILIESKNYNPFVAANALGAVEIIRNGNVTSIGVHSGNSTIFQVDLISADSSYYDFAEFYYSYNDVNNIKGRTARRLNFKLGHDGLWYCLRDKDNSDHVVDNILVTDDWVKATEFLGYNPDILRRGFDTLEEIYQYAMSSPYTVPEIFLLENRNYRSRVQDAKRKTYMGFLDWLRDNYDVGEETTDEQKIQLRKESLQRAFDFFPDFKPKVDELYAKFELSKLIKSKINGKLVKEILNLTVNDGERYIKPILNNLANETILTKTESEIIELIKQEYQKLV